MSTTDPTDRSQAGIAAHWLKPRQRWTPPAESTKRRGFAPRGRLCSVPDCGRPHLARDYCATHYARVYQYGWPDAVTPPVDRRNPGPPERQCSVPGCGRKNVGHGYCRTHYHRVYVYGWDTPERKRAW